MPAAPSFRGTALSGIQELSFCHLAYYSSRSSGSFCWLCFRREAFLLSREGDRRADHFSRFRRGGALFLRIIFDFFTNLATSPRQLIGMSSLADSSSVLEYRRLLIIGEEKKKKKIPRGPDVQHMTRAKNNPSSCGVFALLVRFLNYPQLYMYTTSLRARNCERLCPGHKTRVAAEIDVIRIRTRSLWE